MDDLGDAVLEEAEFFRCVEGPKHHVGEESSASFNRPHSSKAKMLVISARFGSAFVALRNSISVYELTAVRKEKPVVAKSRVSLPGSFSAIAMELVMSDDFLIVQVQEDAPARLSRLWMVDVKSLIHGKFVQRGFPLSSRGAHRAFSTYSRSVSSRPKLEESQKDMLAAITSEGRVEVFELSKNSCKQLWSDDADVSESKSAVSVAFATDGARLAVGTMRGSIQIRDSRTGGEDDIVKEVESGWVPRSLSFISDDDLLACYKNDTSALQHIVWRVGNGKQTSHSVLGELFFASPGAEGTESEHNELSMLCAPVVGWGICPIGNSVSSELSVAARRDDGSWIEWDLDEGKRAVLPLHSNPEEESLPLGMAIDYTDMSRLPSLAANEPLRNPMPRLLVLTSDEALLSFSLVDDRKGAKCIAVTNIVPETPECPVTTELPPSAFVGPEVNAVQPLVEAPSGAVSEAPLFKASSSVFEKPSGVGMTSLFANVAQSYPKERGIFPGGEFRIATPETKQQFLGAFSFPSAQLSESDDSPKPVQEVLPLSSGASYAVRRGVPAPNIAVAMSAAENDDPVEQVRSILLEMQQELNTASQISEATRASVLEAKDEIEANINDAQKRLMCLLDIARDCFTAQSETRQDVNGALQQVLENGYNFEDLSLLSTLLTDQNDSRPLPRHIVDIDKKLSKKETEIVTSLNRIEDKLEEPIDTMRSDSGSPKWKSHSQVTQHIYSSLSLQSIRIKRIKSLLNSFSRQIAGSTLSHSEQRVTDLGLSLSRLERLSLYAAGSPSRVSKVGSEMKNEPRKLRSVPGRQQKSETSQPEKISEVSATALLPESASILRRLAMRKERSRIVVSPLAPASDNVPQSRRCGAASRPSNTLYANVVQTDQPSFNSGGSFATEHGSVKPVNTVPRRSQPSTEIAVAENGNLLASKESSSPSSPSRLNTGLSSSFPNQVHAPKSFANIKETVVLPAVSMHTTKAPSFSFGGTPTDGSAGPKNNNFDSKVADSRLYPAMDMTSNKEGSSFRSKKLKVEFADLPSHDSASESALDTSVSGGESARDSKSVLGTPQEVLAPAPKAPVQLAFLPPEVSAFEDVRETQVKGASEKNINVTPTVVSKDPVQRAFLPPEESAFEDVSQADVPSSADGSKKHTAAASALGSGKRDSTFAPSSALPPKPSIMTQSGVTLSPDVQETPVQFLSITAVSKERTPLDNMKNGSLFAALPPDSDEEPGDEEPLPLRSLSTSSQTAPSPSTTEPKSVAASDSRIAVLPPDPDETIEKERKPAAAEGGHPRTSPGVSGFPKSQPPKVAVHNRGMVDSDTASDDADSKPNESRLSKPSNLGSSSALLGSAATGASTSGSEMVFGSSSSKLVSTPGSLFARPDSSNFGFGTSNPAGWGSASNASTQSVSLFDSKPTTLFGSNSSAQAASHSPSPFGQFGGPQNATQMSGPVSMGMQNSVFTSPTTTAFGSTSTFGAQSSIGGASGFAASSVLGAAPSFGAPSALGQQSLFGAPSPLGSRNSSGIQTSPFGTVQGTSAPLFGSQPSTASGFAALAQSGSGFVFGEASASGFGGGQSGSPFTQVASSAPVFGSAMQSQNGFGATQGTGFGGGQASGFASLAGTGGGFGQESQSRPSGFQSAAFTQRRA